ncbi:alanine racemase [bacterium CPR1]|nr:alanine racemase [bacterium CPR1]
MSEHKYWVEVDLGAIRHNFRRLQERIHPTGILAVVKSEAYGHGLLPVARVAVEEGAWGLGVVTAQEGLKLRQAGLMKPIVVLGPVIETEMERALQADLSLPVHELGLARHLSARAAAMGKSARIHLKVDTGLSRLSVPAEQALEFARAVMAMPNLELEGVYSHLADAEGLDQSYTLRQYQSFQGCLAELAAQGFRPRVRHIAASAAGLLLEATRFDLVRAGITLYGLWPAEETRLLLLSGGQDLLHALNRQFSAGDEVREDFLRPALSFKTVAAQVKDVPQGASVGYGCTFRTQRPTRLAILPLGYAEGYDRSLSNCGEVLIRGQRARVVGRVCMNMTMVDVTDVPDAAPGDEVVLIGRQGQQRVSAEEVAGWSGTINYEVVTRIPTVVPRIYRDERPSA